MATANYLKAAKKQQVQFDSNRITKVFNVGDTVGINVHEVDRTNTDARLLPCKVLSMKEKDETTFYRVYTAHGILKNHFSVDDLADMRNVFFPSLENIDTEDLEEISIIQAARKNNSWNVSAVKGKTLCSCKGTCITNKCRCKKSGLKCSTKCHISNINICQNRI